ncbi:unnamed protein product [Parnassius apollo]|uniref:(apollo) hypothetical protein n=1 Tax=Parnassius apollo TaxID=110799 RepID=A0A8S3WNM9_PARAO|nr:unnamed protein product [Parnassius apollo]
MKPRMKRALQEKEIQNILQEDIPSDPESCVESDSDCGSEPDIYQAPEFTLGNDTIAVQTFNDNFDSDDDIPLANFGSTATTSASTSQPRDDISSTFRPPKWKKATL